MRTRVLADGPTPKKPHIYCDKNIGRHLKKKKNKNAKSVPTSIRFSPTRSKKSQPKGTYRLSSDLQNCTSKSLYCALRRALRSHDLSQKKTLRNHAWPTRWKSSQTSLPSPLSLTSRQSYICLVRGMAKIGHQQVKSATSVAAWWWRGDGGGSVSGIGVSATAQPQRWRQCNTHSKLYHATINSNNFVSKSASSSNSSKSSWTFNF